MALSVQQGWKGLTAGLELQQLTRGSASHRSCTEPQRESTSAQPHCPQPLLLPEAKETAGVVLGPGKSRLGLLSALETEGRH